MTHAYADVASAQQCDLRLAAYMLAIQRVADATELRGVYP
jgi:glutamate dehydrogenase/leucine dehydrogenase